MVCGTTYGGSTPLGQPMPAYDTCYMCKGSGMQDYGAYIDTCYYCNGDCVLIARDSKGRFVKTSDIFDRCTCRCHSDAPNTRHVVACCCAHNYRSRCPQGCHGTGNE